MSVILDALKTDRETKKEIKNYTPLAEGFYLTDTTAHLEQNYLPKYIIYILSSLLLALLAGSIYVYLIKQDVKPEVSIKPAVVVEPISPQQQLVTAAKRFAKSGDSVKAIELYKEALALDGGNALLHNDLAFIYIGLKSYELAQNHLQTAITLDINCATCFNNLGYLQSLTNEHLEAEKNLRRAMFLNPDDPLPYFNLGVLYEQTGNNEKAIEAYEAYTVYADQAVDDKIVNKVRSHIQNLRRPQW